MLHETVRTRSSRAAPALTVAGLVAVAAAFGACSGRERSGPTGLRGERAAPFVIPNAVEGEVTVCKAGGMPGTFAVGGRAGVTAQSPMALASEHCTTVFHKVAADDVTVTVAEAEALDSRLDSIVTIVGGQRTTLAGTHTASVIGDHGAVVVFYNTALVTLCKQGTPGAFTVTGRAGVMVSGLMTLAAGQCVPVFHKVAADDVTVTITEAPPSGTHVDHIERTTLGVTTTVSGSNTISVVGDHGAVLTFVNVPNGR
jgi:hypothetical protein